MSNIADAFQKMSSKFNAEAANGLDAVFQFEVEDSMYHVIIRDNSCQSVEGEHDDSSVKLIMNNQTFSDVVSGETSGMAAFMAGRLKAEGDIMLATRLSDLFSL